MFVLFHGQAHIERGFKTNKDFEKKNHGKFGQTKADGMDPKRRNQFVDLVNADGQISLSHVTQLITLLQHPNFAMRPQL